MLAEGGIAGSTGSGDSEKIKSNAGAITNGDDDAGDGIDEVDGVQRRDSNASQHSTSDDGGFLSRRNFINPRTSWRRPLVASPSQLSLQSAAGSARNLLQGLGGLLRFGSGNVADQTANDANTARYQNVFRNHYGQNIYRNLQPQVAQPATHSTSRPLHINTISGHHHHHHHHPHLVTPNLYTPSRIFSSSPASGGHHNNNNTEAGGGVGLLTSPWALVATPQNSHHHFSDLSTVYPSSAERSFPTPNLSSSAGGGSGGGAANLSRYRYYSHELPSLRTIQEETRRMNHGFVPLQIPSPPSWRNYPYHSQVPYHSYRPRTRWYPRHYSRLFLRSQSELLSPLPHLNLTLRSHAGGGGGGLGLEASPESRSSSSGFGSKNNSNQPHGSHHSGGSTSEWREWRLLPPYRPPPPPPLNSSAYFGSQQQAQAQAPPVNNSSFGGGGGILPYSSATLPNATYYPTQHNSYSYSSSTAAAAHNQPRPITPPYTMGHWLDMISRLNAATDNVNIPKSVDVGSVDGHYEFDPSTPTPSASTPTGGLLRDDLNLHIDTSSTAHHHHNHTHLPPHMMHHHTLGPLGGSIFQTTASGMPLTGSATLSGPLRKARVSRYENIEARLQSMKEEFYAYRKRQAMQRAGVGELESVC